MKVVLLNTSILTVYGRFEYIPATLEAAKSAVQSASEIVSAIGHESTADILTELLSTPVKQNRITYRQEPDDLAVVFKLNGRPAEGQILTREEIEEIGYSFGFLRML